MYESEAKDLLDEDLLDQVMFTNHARVCDMFEVREAQQHRRVKCRRCGEPVLQPFWMGGRFKPNILCCQKCGWQTTCGDFFDSYTGGQAAKYTFMAEEDNPIRRFHQNFSSHVKVQQVAAQLGIHGRSKMPENGLISEIIRLAPELGVNPPVEKGS